MTSPRRQMARESRAVRAVGSVARAVIALVLCVAAHGAWANGITLTPPGPITLFKGGSMYINASTAGGSNFNWHWQASAGSIQRIDPGVFAGSTAFYSVAGLPPGEYLVTVRCNCLGVQPDRVTVSVTVPPVTISIEPVEAVPQTESRTLVAHVTHSNGDVTWTIAPAAGSVSGNVFTASRNPGLYELRATSVAEPSVWTTTLLRVLPPVSVSVGPANVTLAAGGSQAFAAFVENTSNPAVTWSATGGTISAGGLFTAGATGGPFNVQARSVADPTAIGAVDVRVVAVGVTPASVVVPPGTARQFFARVTGTTAAVTWSTTAPGATLSASGVFTPGAATPLGTYTVTARTQGTPVASGSAAVVVQTALPVVGVTVSPAATTLRAGSRLQLAAVVHGQNGELHPQQAVTWSVAGPGSPVVSTSGLLTVPDLAGTYTVTARSVADPTRATTAVLSVPREVVLAPAWREVDLAGSAAFQATAFGFGNPAVLWSVQEGAAGGTVTAQGTYTAPASPGTYHIVARAAAGPATQATATASVKTLKDIRVTVVPTEVTLAPGDAFDFTAQVTGVDDPSVTWSSSDGSIDPKSGSFSAPPYPRGVVVSATSVAEKSVSGRAVVLVAEPGGQDFTYDTAGQLLSDGTRTFEWDAEGRLLAVVAGARRTEFRYDAWGRRWLTTVIDNGTVTSRRRSLWLGDQLLEERDAFTGGPEVVAARYFFGGVQAGSASHFYVYDHLTGVRQLVDQAGQVVGRYDYDPFGQLTVQQGQPPRFGFAGYLRDASTGLALTPARAYDATLGRWLSRDPLEEAGGLNLYAYAFNDPVNLRDPSGLSPNDWYSPRGDPPRSDRLCTGAFPRGIPQPPVPVTPGPGAPDVSPPCPLGLQCWSLPRPPRRLTEAERFYLVTTTDPNDIRRNPDWGLDLHPQDRARVMAGVALWGMLGGFGNGLGMARGRPVPGPGSGWGSTNMVWRDQRPVYPPASGRP